MNTVFVIVGITRGDELIGPEAKCLKASLARAEAEEEARKMTAFQDDWLSEHEVPCVAAGSIYSRFEVIEVPMMRKAA